MANEVIGELGKAARGGAIALVGLVIASLFGFLVRALIGRVYGPTQYGVYNLAFTVFTITLMVVMLGFPMGVQRQVSFFLAKNPERTPALISTAMITVIGTSTLGLIVLEAIKNYLPAYIGGDGLLPILVSILAIGLPVSSVFNTLISTSQGFKRVREYVFYGKIAVPVLYFLFTGIVAVGIKGSIIHVVCTYVLVQLIGLTLMARDLKKAGIIPKRPVFSTKLAKNLVTFSVPLMFSNIVWFIMTWTDTLMLGHYLGSEIVGIYNAASPLARFVPIFLAAFTVIYSPIVTQLHAKGMNTEINRVYASVTKWILLLTYPLFAILFLYPEPVIKTLFGTNYIEAWKPLMILTIGFMVHSAVGPNGLTLISIGKPTQEMIGNVIGALLNVLINLLLIPKYGMVGAAIATSVSYIMANVYKQLILLRRGIHPFTRGYWIVVLVGAVMTSIGLLIRTESIITAMILIAAYSLVFYGITIVLGVFDNTDIELARLLVRKLNITKLERAVSLLEKFSK